MPDIEVVAVIIAKPGSAPIVAAALRDLAVATRGEPGCVTYELYSSESSDQTFITKETWRSRADLDAHMTTPHMAAALAAAGEHLAAAPGIHPLVPDPG